MSDQVEKRQLPCFQVTSYRVTGWVNVLELIDVGPDGDPNGDVIASVEMEDQNELDYEDALNEREADADELSKWMNQLTPSYTEADMQESLAKLGLALPPTILGLPIESFDADGDDEPSSEATRPTSSSEPSGGGSTPATPSVVIVPTVYDPIPAEVALIAVHDVRLGNMTLYVAVDLDGNVLGSCGDLSELRIGNPDAAQIYTFAKLKHPEDTFNG